MRATAFGEQRISPLDRFIFWLRSRQLMRHIPKPCPLAVELGCGFEGNLLRQLIVDGRVTGAHGIDLSVVGAHPAAGVTLETGNLNSGKVELPDSSADLVVSLAVIEHLENPAHLVAEAHRLLKKGGAFVLTTPSPLAKPVLEFMAYILHIIDEAEIRDHKHYFTKAELAHLLRDAGFEGISVKRFLFGLNTIAVATRLSPLSTSVDA